MLQAVDCETHGQVPIYFSAHASRRCVYRPAAGSHQGWFQGRKDSRISAGAKQPEGSIV